MKTKKFFTIFDKDKFVFASKIIVLFLFLVAIFNLLDVAYSKYESKANMYADANIAFFIVDTGTYENSISIKGLTPSKEPFIYTINVYNHKNNKRANVNMQYKIKFETTTNLPLTYQIIRNEKYSADAVNIISSNTLRQDADVYYNVFNINNTYNFSHTKDEMDQYTIVVNFPEQYKNNPDDYQGKIELISVIIDAEQVV